MFINQRDYRAESCCAHCKSRNLTWSIDPKVFFPLYFLFLSLNVILVISVVKLNLLYFISVHRDSMISARSARAISENEIRDSLPAEESERSGSLFDLAMESMANFFGSHSLIMKFPTENSFLGRAIKALRHKKHKKHWMAQLALALAVKALILTLMSKCKGGGHSGGLVKLVDNGGGAAAQTDMNAATGFAEQYPYSRTYDRAQNMAYNAYYPEN